MEDNLTLMDYQKQDLPEIEVDTHYMKSNTTNDMSSSHGINSTTIWKTSPSTPSSDATKIFWMGHLFEQSPRPHGSSAWIRTTPSQPISGS